MNGPVMPNPGVRFPPPLIFVAGMLAAYLLGRAWPVPLLPHSLHGIALGFGWMMVAGSTAFVGWALLTFRRARTAIVPVRPATVLVCSGPYARTRNPMYLGLTLIFLGTTALLNSIWPLVLLPVVMFVLTRFVIDREERYLTGAFGNQYADYQRRVRRWL